MINVRGLTKSYPHPAGTFQALRGIDLEIGPGEFVAIVGKSGSGKSTLLNMLGGIDRPTSGSVAVEGTAIESLSRDALARWRGRRVGFVFQSFQLLPTLTVLENVMLPMDFANFGPVGERAARGRDLLAQVGVADQADKLPSALSGGQQQRAAIARALANDPPLVLADEPTGNLDSATGEAIFRLFATLVDAGRTVVVVTHDRDAASGVRRRITLADGSVVA
jgi:putative ABC transport system ATP-binding protein